MGPGGAARVLKAAGPALRASGFDVVWPITVGLYNTKVVQANIGTAKLTPLPTYSHGDETLALLVGNSRGLWKPFKASYQRNETVQRCPHPLDLGYVKPALRKIFERILPNSMDSLRGRPLDLRLAHETDPDRIVAFTRLAHEAGLATLCPRTMLSIHPLLGPWLSYRAVVVLDVRVDPQEDLAEVARFSTSHRSQYLWGWSPSRDDYSAAVLAAEEFGRKEAGLSRSDDCNNSSNSRWQWGEPSPPMYDQNASERLRLLTEGLLEYQSPASFDDGDSVPQYELTEASKAWIMLRQAVASEVDKAQQLPNYSTSQWEYTPEHLLYHYDRNRNAFEG